MITDWKKEIAIAWYVQEKTAECDINKLWDYYLPKVAATEQELIEAEAALGFALDPRYREFLSYANGWRCFLQRIDLFGTNELRGSDSMREAWIALDEVDSSSLGKRGLICSVSTPVVGSTEPFPITDVVYGC